MLQDRGRHCREELMTFDDILEKYRSTQYSMRDEGTRFEELMKAWLLTEPTYITTIEKVWM